MTDRRSMARALLGDAARPTKTFVVETHSDDPVGHLHDLVGTSQVEETDDAYLYRAHLPGGTFWVDMLDPRFWSWHTDMTQAEAYPFLRDRVEQRRDLDWMWLPSGHLEVARPGATTRVRTSYDATRLAGDGDSAHGLKVTFDGRAADSLLGLIRSDPRFSGAVSFDAVEAVVADEDLGVVREALTRAGRFVVVGDSFELHGNFVRGVVRQYAALVRACESHALSCIGNEDPAGGGRVDGAPVTLLFSRDIPDLSRFADELLSARQPFRLWGVPDVTEELVEVDAVDLHVGQRLTLDIGRRWMRVYLESGGCGNTVARLISNLQHRFDGALTMADPGLQTLVSPSGTTSSPGRPEMVPV